MDNFAGVNHAGHPEPTEADASDTSVPTLPLSELRKGYRQKPYVFELPPETPPDVVIEIGEKIAEAARRAIAEAKADLNRQRMEAARRRVLDDKRGVPRADFFLQAGERARELRKNGCETPIQDAAREFGIPPETVRVWEKTANKAHTEQARASRNRLICRLLAEGKSNAAIAREVGCSRGTVAAIAGDAFRRGRGKALFE